MPNSDDAYGRWCPFSRGVYIGEEKDTVDEAKERAIMAGHNRIGMHPDSIDAVLGYCMCVSSDCMAWRWAEPERDDDSRRGYCGLAGKPEFIE